MKTETIATRNFMEYVERNNMQPTKEDILNMLAMLPLFLGDVNIEIKTTAKKKNKKTNKNQVENNIVNSSDDVLNQLRNLQSNSEKKLTMEDVKKNNISLTPLLEKYGSWRNIKRELIESPKGNNSNSKKRTAKKNNNVEQNNKNNEDVEQNNNLEKRTNNKKTRTSSIEKELISLTTSLNKVPTREDIKDIDISKLLNKYGSWKNIKREIGLYDIYEKNMTKKILEIQKNSGKKPTMQMCKDNGIDVIYFIKKYGGWKEAISEILKK